MIVMTSLCCVVGCASDCDDVTILCSRLDVMMMTSLCCVIDCASDYDDVTLCL